MRYQPLSDCLSAKPVHRAASQEVLPCSHGGVEPGVRACRDAAAVATLSRMLRVARETRDLDSLPASAIAASELSVGSTTPVGDERIPRQDGSVVDLFCSVGGLSHGFVLEGFDVRAGVDVDASCRYAYERNNRARFVERDVTCLGGDQVGRLFNATEPRILVGCAPCQPFSPYSQNRSDAKWRLLAEFGRIVDEVRPEVVSMENVPRLVTFHRGELFRQFLALLEDAGYEVWWRVVNCADYGVPQTRQRLVVLASRVGPIELVSPTHEPDAYVTVQDAIASLPPLTAGHGDVEDPLHYASRLSEVNLARIRDAKPGKSWHEWDPDLVAACHRKRTGRWFRSVYGRMRWDAPAPTITTQCNGFGNGRFGHPEQDRAISLREAALLQTFPPDYEFLDPKKRWFVSAAARWIGNAVPVELARAVARSVALALDGA